MRVSLWLFFFFTIPPPTRISPFSLPAAFPIPADGLHAVLGRPVGEHQATHLASAGRRLPLFGRRHAHDALGDELLDVLPRRSEEHTSELQSLAYLVCRLLLEKKKTPTASHTLS